MNGNGNGDKNDDEKFIAKNVYTFLISLLGPNKEKDSLPNLMIIKGLASTLTDSILIQTQENDHDQDMSSNSNSNRTLLIHPIASYMIQMSQCSANDAIRLWALKGLGTVVGRCKAIVASNADSNSNNTTQLHDLFVTQARELANDVLQLSLVTFDSPPCKQIGSAIPGLFKSLVDLMEILDQKTHHHNDDDEDNENTKMESMEILVGRILAQPPSRKGKYIALDSLLYKIGASKLMQLAEVQESESLVSSFVQEIGDRGNSAGSVAELLGKIISLLREEMHREAGIDLHRAEETKKERRRREKKIREQGVEKSDVSNEDVVRLLPQWMNVWVPSFASAMLSLRRKHISSYCLPLIIAMVGGTSRKMDACHSFAALLDELDNRKDATDCLLWAKLEVIRHASLHKLLKSNLCSNILRNSVSKVVTLDVLKMALIHESSKIRVVAFQTIGSILPTLSEELSKDPIKCILLEAELWKESLVYAFNCSEREHMLVLNSTLQGFLHKIVEVETTHVHDRTSSILFKFVNDILLNNLFLKQGYPGTIPEKESFALKMLDSIIIFSSRTNVNKKVTPKTKSFEQDWNSNIIAALVSDNVFANLLSLLYSMWDATRESAYSCICKLIELARHDKLPLPHFFTSEDSYSLLRARATHLASSPRQREADTGARMLAILCAVLPTEEEREKNLKNLSQYLVKRLDLMAKSLGVAFNPRIEDANLDDSEQMAANSNELPLAHGLIQALRLIIDDNRVINITDSQIIFVDLTSICCHAIEVSLAVVADIKDDTSDKKLEQEKGGATKQSWKLARAKKLESTPLNVNTGALGANATFASCMPTGEELTKRLAMQRILVGSWLLTKEACAALSSVITLIPGQIDYNIISTAGDLLISTLTSLKHQGAAFAAHKSLQKVCARCYKEGDGNGIRLLPSSWSQRLIFEISSPEIVRDSILRRSTGYGLGTLSILRTEECSGPRFLFPTILSSIIKLSLPSSSIMKKYSRRWKFSSVGEMFQYACNLIETESDFVEDKDYEWRTRIHALNILRLIILDAPLASDMRKFIGDSLLSALIGYTDASWGVRNSATMTFAAVMLRVVDADKNAAVKEKGIRSEVGISAITATELFRSYPPLASALLALLKEETDKVSRQNMVHPTLFPLLLLLSRLQPISISRIDPSTSDISNMFIDPVLCCLGHVHQKVRIVAARALTVLCSGDNGKSCGKDSSRSILIQKCIKLLSITSNSKTRLDHNQDHGVLLAIRNLLTSCSEPQIYFDEMLMNALSFYGSWGNYQGTCPPVCVVIALEIWHCIHKSVHNNFELSSIGKTPYGESLNFKDTVFKVVRYVEAISSSGKSVIGLAALGSNAAKIAVEISYPVIFNPTDLTSCQVHLDMVQNLICSSSYDVMLHSVKSFKKKICYSVDTMIDDTQTPFNKRKIMLRCVCRMLINSLFNLMNRDGISAHPPTIRRVSRCIIESAVGYKSLSESTGLTEISEYSSFEMFQQFAAILSLHSETNSNGGNIGNALELMALTVVDLCVCNDDSYSKEHFERDVTFFVKQICASTDPETSWKVRHSAAIGVKESGLLSLKIDDSNPFQPIIEHCKMKLYFQMIQLLQDGDEDVRKAAARALLPASNTPTTSLRNLELGYEEACDMCSSDELFTMLAKQIICHCKNVEINVTEMTNEFDYTVGDKDLADVQNLSTERKIFEEEDLNVFEESLLIIHLSIQKLTRISKTYKHQDSEDRELFQDLILICKRVLKRINCIKGQIGQTADIAHNLSWTIKVFPGIHGLLLGSIFSIYHFGTEGNDIVEEANKVLIEGNLIHPCISEALNVLSHARYNCNATFDSLLKCCFLAPI